MAFIKAQKIVRDDSGAVISGSAAVVDSVYVKTGSNSHSRQEVREKLGKVLYLSEDKKVGIFLSPTRGLVEYNASTDAFSEVDRSDPRINAEEFFPEPEVHTVFGDAYLLLQFLEKCGLISVLRSVFPKDEAYERVLCHILHGVLRDGSRLRNTTFPQRRSITYSGPQTTIPCRIRYGGWIQRSNTGTGKKKRKRAGTTWLIHVRHIPRQSRRSIRDLPMLSWS